MSELRELYQQLIIDHGRHPRNFGKLLNANHSLEGFNPLCGDRLTVYLLAEDGVIKAAQFEGSGCAISIASASLMTQALTGKTIKQAKVLFEHFHNLVTDQAVTNEEEALGKLIVLAGVKAFPMRVKCATLCWHTAMAALQNSQAPVSTE